MNKRSTLPASASGGMQMQPLLQTGDPLLYNQNHGWLSPQYYPAPPYTQATSPMYPALGEKPQGQQDQGQGSNAQTGSDPQDPNQQRIIAVKKIEQELKDEIAKRQLLFKKYRRGANAATGTSTVSTAISVGTVATSASLALTVIGAPIAFSLLGLHVTCAGLSVAGHFLSRRFTNRSRKHSEIVVLAASILNSIDDIVTRAEAGQTVSPDDVSKVTDALERFTQQKATIRTSHGCKP